MPVEGIISRVVIVITHNTVCAAIFYSSYTYLLTILLHYNGIAVPAISCTIMHLDDNLRHIGGPYSGNGGVGLNGYVIAWLILILAYLPCLEHHTIGSSECTFGQRILAIADAISHFALAVTSCKGDGVFRLGLFTDRTIHRVHNSAYRVSFAVEEAIALRQ